MKVYLDNNIVSAIAKDDEPAESDALDRLLIAWRKGIPSMARCSSLGWRRSMRNPYTSLASRRVIPFLRAIRVFSDGPQASRKSSRR
jgi:hypothetical protein